MSQVEYTETVATRAMRDLPRFGHSATFAYLFGNRDQQSDYIYGLLFGGVLILSFFFVWTILIPIFCCLGKNKVGFLSGSSFHDSHESKRPRRVRTTFIIAAIILVVFSVLLVTEGITQLRTGVDTVYDSVSDVFSLLEKADELLTKVDELAQDEAAPIRDELVAQLSQVDFCAALRNETNTNLDALVNETISFLNDLDDMNKDGLTNARNALDQAVDTTGQFQQNVENIQLSDWQSLIFIIPFPLFCTIFVIGVVLAWRGHSYKWLTCIITWVVLPLFCLLIFVCYVLSGGIAIAASMNADFCSGGSDQTPDGSIQEIMNINGFDEQDLVYRVLMFYVHQCENDVDPLDFLHNYEHQLINASEVVAELEVALTNITVDVLTEICGPGNYNNTINLLSVMLSKLDTLLTGLGETLQLFACETIVPIYTGAFYNGTCTYSVRGVTWTFGAFLVIGVMGMLMITLRSSWHPTTYIEDEKMTPMEYEGQEVEYTPYNPDEPLEQEETTEEGTADYGLEADGGDGAATAAVAGVAAAGIGVAAMADDGEGQEMEYTPCDPDQSLEQQGSTAEYGPQEAAGAAVAGVEAAGMTLSQDNSIPASATDGSGPPAAANAGATSDDKISSFDDTNWLDVPEHDAAPQDAPPPTNSATSMSGSTF